MPIQPGDIIRGHLIPPSSSSSVPTKKTRDAEFPHIHFGLKTATPFHVSELDAKDFYEGEHGEKEMSATIKTLESAFNTAEFEVKGSTMELGTMPELSKEVKGDEEGEISVVKSGVEEVDGVQEENVAMILCGRPVGVNRGGAAIKVFDVVAFEPMYHVMKIEGKTSKDVVLYSLLQTGNNGAVISSYGGWFYTLAELTGREESWKKSGGGSDKERLMYLKLFMNLLRVKNRNARMRLDGFGHRLYPERSRSSFARTSLGSIKW